jgi:hypothetical protein
MMGTANTTGRQRAVLTNRASRLISGSVGRSAMQVQVHPVHFEDFSGTQFERLCFA